MFSFPRAWSLLTAGLALLFAALGQGQNPGQHSPTAAPAPLPPGAVARLGPAGGKARPVAGKCEAIFAAELTPDGKTVVTVGQDGTTRTWDAASGKQASSFKAEPVPLGLSADGRVLAARSADGRADLRGQYGDLLPAQRRGANRLDGRIVLRDAATGKRLGEVKAPAGGDSALGPGGRVLASASFADKEIGVWNVVNGRCLHRFRGAEGWSAGRPALQLGALGNLGGQFGIAGGGGALGGPGNLGGAFGIAGGGGALGGGGLVGGPLQGGGLCNLTFSADGRSLAAGWGNAVRVWRLDTGRSLRAFDKAAAEDEGPRGGTAAFSPDGRTLATAGPDGVVRLWEVSTGRLRWRTMQVARPCGALRFSPDGRLLAVASRLLGTTVRLFNLATGQEGETPGGHAASVTCLAFSPDGTRLASGSEDGSALLWDVRALLGRAPAAPAVRAADLDAWWRDLAGADGEKAYTALWRLAAVPDQAVPLLRERLRPAAPVGARPVERLVADLDADDFAVREAATRELERLGQRAEAALQRAVARPASTEMKRRAERLLARLDGGRLPAEDLRALRALEVLEAAGTPAARELMRALAKGSPDAALTQEAAAALGRLERRLSAPARGGR